MNTPSVIKKMFIIQKINHTYRMGTIRQINMKNWTYYFNMKDWTYYFYNDIFDLEYFDSSLLKLDKKSYKDIRIYNIGYITIKEIGNCKNIYSVNPLWLRINDASGYIEEINENKYLIFDCVDENKDLLKKYNDVFNRIMDKIKELSNDEYDYEKDYIKISFNSDDNLPLNKPLKFHNMTITIRPVFEEDGNLYPQIFLIDTFYELST